MKKLIFLLLGLATAVQSFGQVQITGGTLSGLSGSGSGGASDFSGAWTSTHNTEAAVWTNSLGTNRAIWLQSWVVGAGPTNWYSRQSAHLFWRGTGVTHLAASSAIAVNRSDAGITTRWDTNAQPGNAVLYVSGMTNENMSWSFRGIVTETTNGTAATYVPPACDVVKFASVGSGESSAVFGTTASPWRAAKVVATNSYTLCSWSAELLKTGSPTMTLTGYIYADAAGAPGTVLGTGTSVSATTLSTNAGGWVTFSGFDVSITNGGTYWHVIGTSATSFSDYVSWRGNAAFCNGCNILSTNGINWAAGSSKALAVKDYSQ